MSDAAAAKRSATLHIDRREKADPAAVTAAASKTGVPFEISLPALPHSDAVYTPREERANALTHAVGIPLALLFLVFMLLKAEGLLQVISALAFGIGTTSVFLASSLYHAARDARLKKTLRIFDHAAIYLNIAGLYTPYMLALPPDEGGVSMAAAVWTLAILGILIEFFWVGRPKWLIGLTYVLLGWGLMFKGPAIYAAIGLPGLSLLIIGGALCSLGVIFYVQKSKEFMHAVFHLFVLVSIVPTWASIYGYVLG